MIRDFHLPGRSTAIACNAMAATSHPLATLAAIDALRAGGTAADAAVAAVAVLGVVEPAMTGIGGDCFCLVAKPNLPIWGYNGSGRAAATMRAETLLEQGITSIGPDSVHAVTVPGAVEAWDVILAAHGRFGLDRALAPAIRHAEEGFPVLPRVGFDWAMWQHRLRGDAGASRHYLKDGQAPAVGDLVRLPALADTLRKIAAQGPRAFYEGPVAEDIVAALQGRGGLLRADDFARHRGELAVPISADYRGLEVVELPPNGMGLTALVLLNIVERFDLAVLDPVGSERYHIALEAARLAYAVRDTHVADPPFMRTPVPALIDKAFAGKLADRIDRSRRMPPAPLPMPGGDTTYVTVVDRDRMVVSLINSVSGAFGVGIATERSGVLLQNRGTYFVVDSAHPNGIGPGKRSLHSIIPAMAQRDGRCVMSFGVMGGEYQPMGHAQVVTNMVDYRMDVQAAIDLPRLFFDGQRTMVERGIPATTIDGLKARGHSIAVRPSPYGGGQAITIDWERGLLIGGSDFRKDGLALGY
jgi:gamma-glutamyltranspeptidase/glutathione hydrolase